MKWLTTAAVVAMSIFSLSAKYGEDHLIKIWDNSTAPHSNNIEGAEMERQPNRVSNVSESEIYVFVAPKDLATGQAVVICPGGGYSQLAIDYEGYEVAKWYAEHGITAAVLKYRMPNGVKEVPLEDGIEALRILRKRAKEFNIDPSKVGISGYSAGGHLAAYVSTMAEDMDKPNFSILFYPVISGEEGVGHLGSFNKLLGMNRSAEQTTYYSLENRVGETTPPAILFLSDDDKTVKSVNSVLYYEALKRHNIISSIHIYPIGGHGWGFRENFKYFEEWKASLLDWLEMINK